MTTPLKIAYIISGVLFFIMGAIGTVLPLLPTTPFILLAAVCFGRSSQKLHTWFLSTRLYQKTVNKFIENRTMSIKAKIILLTSITVFMNVSFLTMIIINAPIIVRIILIIIWILHMIYFGYIVKTAKS